MIHLGVKHFTTYHWTWFITEKRGYKTRPNKYNEIREHNNVCDAFPTQNGLKQEAAFLQIRFNFNKRH